MDVVAQVSALLGEPVQAARLRGGGITGRTWQVSLASGATVFVKSRGDAPDGFFAAEVTGLRWLAEVPDGPPVPTVLAHDARTVVLPWIEAGEPSAAAAAELGRGLAQLHAAGAPAFGAAWPGWIGAAPLDNRPAASWPEFYATRRVLPYVRMLRDAGAIDRSGAGRFEQFAARLPELTGPPEPPARIHGDLWGGNVLWATDGAGWLVDPAAHGGHRETDLAMLALFGSPYLEQVVAGYVDHTPLAPGWRDRVALHQVHPLLVHAVLFGGGYLAQAQAATSRYVTADP